eukprot:g2249.t1
MSRPVKRRTGRGGESDKNLKGLRHFSIKVCQKVEEKQVTSYNEVADALVREYIEGQMAQDEVLTQVHPKRYDEKNIRRRVYDALNVLMAMDIISKEKKEIRWQGLPSNATMDCDTLERQVTQIGSTIKRKQRHLEDKVRQLVAFKQLVERNASRERKESEKPCTQAEEQVQTVKKENEEQAANVAEQKAESKVTVVQTDDSKRLTLPFVMVNTHSRHKVEVTKADNGQEVEFDIEGPFTLNDENMVLQHMQLHEAPDEKLKEMLPESWMWPFANLGPDKVPYKHPAERLAEVEAERAAAAAATSGGSRVHSAPPSATKADGSGTPAMLPPRAPAGSRNARTRAAHSQSSAAVANAGMPKLSVDPSAHSTVDVVSTETPRRLQGDVADELAAAIPAPTTAVDSLASVGMAYDKTSTMPAPTPIQKKPKRKAGAAAPFASPTLLMCEPMFQSPMNFDM